MRIAFFHAAIWLTTIAALLPFVLGSGGFVSGWGWWTQKSAQIPNSVLVCVAGIVVLEIIIIIVSRRISRDLKLTRENS